MSIKTKIDLETWNRKEHFEFFSKMEEPFWGITTTLDVTQAYHKAKSLSISFFTYYLYQTLCAVNSVENFKLRILNNDVYLFDTIDASATVMRNDTTFGFSYMKFDKDLQLFQSIVLDEINRIQQTTGLFTKLDFPENLIHFSALPWVNFSALSHARGFSYPDSCPKISWGKLIDIDNKKTMSVSIHVHHGLVDGYHVGVFVEKLQELLNS